MDNYLILHSLLAYKFLKTHKMLTSGENLSKCLRVLNPYSEMKYEP